MQWKLLNTLNLINSYGQKVTFTRPGDLSGMIEELKPLVQGGQVLDSVHWDLTYFYTGELLFSTKSYIFVSYTKLTVISIKRFETLPVWTHPIGDLAA